MAQSKTSKTAVWILMGLLILGLGGFGATSLTGTVRTVGYLLHQAPADADSFELQVAKSVIASRLSVKPETFSRILKNLHESEIVSIDGRQVTIHDRAAMITICSG